MSRTAIRGNGSACVDIKGLASRASGDRGRRSSVEAANSSSPQPTQGEVEPTIDAIVVSIPIMAISIQKTRPPARSRMAPTADVLYDFHGKGARPETAFFFR